MRIKNRKGQVGLDTSKAVMMTLLTIGVIGFLVILLLANLGNTEVAKTSGSESVSNETGINLSIAGGDLAGLSKADAVCTILATRNTTGQTISNAGDGNFTTSNGGCTLVAADTINETINGTLIQVDYSYTYNQFAGIEGNVSEGTTDFFSNAGTWFALLAVVVIILIIAIVIFAVNRFGGRSGSSL